MIPVRDLDTKRYGRLLARTLPLVIESDQERDRAHEIVETLMAKKPRTREETELLRLVAQLIQDYEARGRAEPASGAWHKLAAWSYRQRAAGIGPLKGPRHRPVEVIDESFDSLA